MTKYTTTRYEYLKLLAPKITDELIVTSLGGVVREWYRAKDHDGNLYNAWMAGSTNIALGLALALPHRQVISLDSDGSMLMDLAILPVIADTNPGNLIVIVFDNEIYECLPPGTVPTQTSGPTDLVSMAQGAGIKNCGLVKEPAEFREAVNEAFQAKEASFIVVKVERIHESLDYPTFLGTENKFRFIRYIEKTENMEILRRPGIREAFMKEKRT